MKRLEIAKANCNHGPDGTFPWEGGSRIGTVYAEYRDLCIALGRPHQFYPGEADDKVTYKWEIQTPRGVASIYDYWWSANGHWSIGAKDRRVNRWVHRYLRSLGCPVLELSEELSKIWRAVPFARLNRTDADQAVDLQLWKKLQNEQNQADQVPQ